LAVSASTCACAFLRSPPLLGFHCEIVRDSAWHVACYSKRGQAQSAARRVPIGSKRACIMMLRFANGGSMKRWTMSAIACALSALFVTPLLAQSTTGTGSSTSATMSAAPATRPPAATSANSCAGMSGAARTDCENAENASNALCFGMSGARLNDCVNSYYPNKSPNPMAARPDSGAAGTGSSTGASGAAGTGSSAGASGAAGAGTGSSAGASGAAGTGSSSGGASGSAK